MTQEAALARARELAQTGHGTQVVICKLDKYGKPSTFETSSATSALPRGFRLWAYVSVKDGLIRKVM